MRRIIFGIVILLAVPAYAQRQNQDHSAATPRTAIPREPGVQAAPAARSERDAERRGERRDRTSLNPGFKTTLNPGFRTALNPGFRPPDDREQWRPQYQGDYRPRRRHGVGNVLLVPYFSPVVVEREIVVERRVADETPLAPVVFEQPSPARLILDVHPPTAQIFADGYYIGIPEDFRIENGGAVLEPGPHQIDILARDYEPVRFSVNLTRGQSATFRHALTPTARAPQSTPPAAVNPAPAVKAPATFYLIRGCYMGNVPPKEANLPATCDVASVVTFQY